MFQPTTTTQYSPKGYALTTRKSDIDAQIRDWWQSVNNHCVAFFNVSSEFGLTRKPYRLSKILREMKKAYTAFKNHPFQAQATSPRDEALSAMQNMIADFEGALNDRNSAAACIHNALLELQYFHILVTSLNMTYGEVAA
jgi:hypothetical protein